METVDIWVDPVCPFAWMTSQWLLEVEKVRDVRARFNLVSLSALNEGREDTNDFYKEGIPRWRKPVRVAMAVLQEHGHDALREFYLAAGTLNHNDDRAYGDDVYREALQSAGLDTALAERADDASLDATIREHHDAGMAQVGTDVGTPVVRYPYGDGGFRAFYGPVVCPPPTGEDAGRLWDGMLVLAQVPGLYEIKRSRDVDPTFLPMPR